MEKITEQGLKGFAKLVLSGITENKIQYVIMQKYGPSLKLMLRKTKAKRFHIKSAIQIGLQMIDRLQAFHNMGYLHLDIKPDNILIGSAARERLESSTIVLIDYGISKKWKDEHDEHIPENRMVPFSGNVLFASKNAFMQIEQSRRDDLISLCYFLAFLLNAELTWHGKLTHQDPNFF
jgi:casein kinase 1